MGLLIINADDLGIDVATTDSILRCFWAGRVSSASALVGMSDSARAATLAREANLPIRLHLNLTEPFSDPSVPADIREPPSQFGWPFCPLAERILDLQSVSATDDRSLYPGSDAHVRATLR